MSKAELVRLAVKGAEARLMEMREEVEKMYQAFHHLLVGDGEKIRPETPAGARQEKTTRRRRRRMSAEARKAASVRMKKYWATKRAGKK